MAQPPPDQNFYHHTHPHSHSHAHPQLQLPPQFRNPFELIFDERTGTINYNYIRPYIPNQIPKPENLSDSLVMRRPRRTRTTFTSAQIAELEQHFLQGRYLTSSRLAELSAKLALGTAQVKIWFKNRRRRHKIQSDQQKDHSFSCDTIQLSPLVANGVKLEQQFNNATSAPPSLHTLSLGGSGASTPTTLTPSPTPTTPSASHVEHYGEAYNPYYFNGSASISQNMSHHSHTGHVQQYPPTTPTATTQFFPSHPTGTQHQHPQLTGAHHHQHQYQSHQYDYQHKTLNGNGSDINIIKEDPDYNFNNSYYMRIQSAAPESITINGGIDPSSNPMSPTSDVYEPLTPKNDESPSLCNRGNRTKANLTDDVDMKSSSKALHSMGDNGSLNSNSRHPAGSSNLVRDCNGAFTKYKVSNGENPDSTFQCTMDTIMQAYSCHRNTSGNAQFAYCFN